MTLDDEHNKTNASSQLTTMTMPPEDMQLCLMGTGGVGKSAIKIQFVQHIFIEEYDPTIEDGYRKMFEVDEQLYRMEILDPIALEYTAMRDQFIRCSQGLILIFALNNRSSFAELPDLVDKILQIKDQDTFPMIMVGNKADLEDERVIDSEEARGLARDLGIEYVECTAKRSVDHIFRQIIRSVQTHRPLNYEHRNRKCTIM